LSSSTVHRVKAIKSSWQISGKPEAVNLCETG
jgi:hypothetical protein